MKVCAFCNMEIEDGESLCNVCIEKYKIRIVSSEDGCACDAK